MSFIFLQEIDELNFGHAIRQDTWNGRNTRPEQVDLRFSLTPDPREGMRWEKVNNERDRVQRMSDCLNRVCVLNVTHKLSGCERFLHPLMSRSEIINKCWQVPKNCLRDHVFGLLVEHLGIGEHHAAAHLLIQVPQDVIDGFPDLGVIQCHTCREQPRLWKTAKRTKTPNTNRQVFVKAKCPDLSVLLPPQLEFCWGRFFSSSVCSQKAKWPLCLAWVVHHLSAAGYRLWRGTPSGRCSFSRHTSENKQKMHFLIALGYMCLYGFKHNSIFIIL